VCARVCVYLRVSLFACGWQCTSAHGVLYLTSVHVPVCVCVCACIMLGLSHSLTHTLLGGGGTWVRLRSRRGRHGESRAGQVHSDTNCSPYREETRRQTDRSSTAAVALAAVLPLALSARTLFAYTRVCFSLSLPKTVCVCTCVPTTSACARASVCTSRAPPRLCVSLCVCGCICVCTYVCVIGAHGHEAGG
jgi:hypothetical protein